MSKTDYQKINTLFMRDENNLIIPNTMTCQEFEYLKDIGCNCIQGYLLGKPMPEEEIENLLLRSV